MIKIFITLLFYFSFVFANDAKEIIKKVDENIRGENLSLKMTIKIVSQGHEREMRIESYSKGSEKSFTKVLYPPKNKGITFLSLNNQMWQYIPKIERVIKIPPSMMLQNWMGTDITNDDMVKQSSIIDDYDAKLLKTKNNIATIELIPKPDSAVVWGKIVTNIDLTTYTSIKDIFYDEDGEKVRYFLYKDVKKYGKYYTPTYFKVSSYDKKDAYTEIWQKDIEYDKDISDQYFKKSALKRFSR
jgi:outer membrane lipoprotein-sorting protein